MSYHHVHGRSQGSMGHSNGDSIANDDGRGGSGGGSGDDGDGGTGVNYDLDSGGISCSGMLLHAVNYSEMEQESRSTTTTMIANDRDNIIKKPTYLLEHLATFTVNKESGIVYPADGMRRLLQLEKTTGIWSQKMQLCLDCHWVLIMDYETGNVIERFPASLIQEPTAFTSTDAMELYNNILVFIVSGGNETRSEMHIFQSQSVSAVHLVEGLKNLKCGNLELSRFDETSQQQQQQQLRQEQSAHKINTSDINSYSNGINKPMPGGHPFSVQMSPIIKEHNQMCGMYGSDNGLDNDIISDGIPGGNGIGGGGIDSEHGAGGLVLNDETSSVSSDKHERDVNVLNHCFDDIEKFIARLQHAAAALRELERRRSNRKSKKKDPGEGLLMLRARPPHEKEFIDIFAKFKLSFNLLAKLKSHIHDPNAPELVHFLFTPLALIVEAASDTYYNAQLPACVVNPLLTREAINLLINCVTSKETELWRSLGATWSVPRDQWKDSVGSYHPVFIDGWSPDYLVVDELLPPSQMHSLPADLKHTYCHSLDEPNNVAENINQHNSLSPFVDEVGCGLYDEYDCQSDKYTNEPMNESCSRVCGVGVSGGGGSGSASVNGDIMNAIHYPSRVGLDIETNHGASLFNEGTHNTKDMQTIIRSVQNLHTRQQLQPTLMPSGPSINSESVKLTNATLQKHNQQSNMANSTVASYNDPKFVEQWLNELQSSGAKIVLVTYPRTANNAKELSVMHGEYLEILDDTRKWWKARNIHGQVAHVPHTIVTPFHYKGNDSIINVSNNHSYIKARVSATVSDALKDNAKYRVA